jgi:hypothetical protein
MKTLPYFLNKNSYKRTIILITKEYWLKFFPSNCQIWGLTVYRREGGKVRRGTFFDGTNGTTAVCVWKKKLFGWSWGWVEGEIYLIEILLSQSVRVYGLEREMVREIEKIQDQWNKNISSFFSWHVWKIVWTIVLNRMKSNFFEANLL